LFEIKKLGEGMLALIPIWYELHNIGEGKNRREKGREEKIRERR